MPASLGIISLFVKPERLFRQPRIAESNSLKYGYLAEKLNTKHEVAVMDDLAYSESRDGGSRGRFAGILALWLVLLAGMLFTLYARHVELSRLAGQFEMIEGRLDRPAQTMTAMVEGSAFTETGGAYHVGD